MFKTQKEIIAKINSSSFGAFTTADFFGIANYKTISKALELLEDQGYLKKARRGIYYKPVINPTLGFEESPDLSEVANAIARQFNWTIIPSGNHSLNLIGISTQVPSKMIYTSSGPYREYTVGAAKIIFKHSTTKVLYSLRKNNLIAIQALKELGKENLTSKEMALISRFLDKDDKREIMNGIRTTSWIYDSLRRIACIQLQN